MSTPKISDFPDPERSFGIPRPKFISALVFAGFALGSLFLPLSPYEPLHRFFIIPFLTFFICAVFSAFMSTRYVIQRRLVAEKKYLNNVKGWFNDYYKVELTDEQMTELWEGRIADVEVVGKKRPVKMCLFGPELSLTFRRVYGGEKMPKPDRLRLKVVGTEEEFTPLSERVETF